MNKIISKRQFSEKVFCFDIEAPLIAQSRRAGNFVIVRVDKNSERMPLTIADADKVRGTIKLVVQKVGLSSTKLCNLNKGDEVADVVGPLGNPTHIENFGHLCRRWCWRGPHASYYPCIEGSRQPCSICFGRS